MKTDRGQELPYFPVKCPVCNGFGTVNWGKAICHGCQGKGYIIILNKKEKKKDEKRKLE